MNGNKIIVHTLISVNDKYLVTKRSKLETTFPEYWDIPGGLADYGELPKEAVIRETFEEVGLHIKPTRIIHEDSNLDEESDLNLIYRMNNDNREEYMQLINNFNLSKKINRFSKIRNKILYRSEYMYLDRSIYSLNYKK